MLLINCPYCGEREQEEFTCGGEAHIERPKNPPDLSDDQWADYLFLRQNIKGLQYERWNHSLVVDNGLMLQEILQLMKY
jgi:heterotetrameric sarcosine oxidase delta subunit